MTTQALTLPLDITWQRLAYSRDMIDTDFSDLDLPPKWRSSMAVYTYVVPEEQTAESYPDARIVYMKLVCSITGWNPSEALRDAVTLEEVGDELDDLQTAIWEAIQSDGWAQTYWPCVGAIAQVAVYPLDSEVPTDDFPFILDFEPKKRELYEARSESGEFLSSTYENVNIQKGTTTVRGSESTHTASANVGFQVPVGPGLLGGGGSYEYSRKNSRSDTSVDMTTTDSARERRETTSFSTNFSQLYQLFNGYHLGTNRALFLVAPRPHIASGAEQTDFNLLDGQRKLEGIQEMFLVVYVPPGLEGICLRASLDTGHDVMSAPGVALRIRDDERHPNGPPEPPPPPPPPPDDDDGDGGDVRYHQLVVTRRVLRACGRFEETGPRLIPLAPPPLDPEGPGGKFPWVVHEGLIADLGRVVALARRAPGTTSMGVPRAEAADRLNVFQRRVVNEMLSGFTAGRYAPRPFVMTNAFARLAKRTARGVRIDLDRLVEREYLSPDEASELRKAGVGTIADLFDDRIIVRRGEIDARVRLVRGRLLKQVQAASRIRPPRDRGGEPTNDSEVRPDRW